VWTGASDGTITIGWLVRNYHIHQDYSVPECEDPLPPITPPTISITGLSQIPLELVWFDDHKGCIIGSHTVRSDGQFPNIAVPNTEPGGFGKSVAFLIQPIGFTPAPVFDELPTENERIGQIIIDPIHRKSWHDEMPWAYWGTLTLTATTKPPITNPFGYTFEWRFDSPIAEPIIIADTPYIQRAYAVSSDWRFVRVDIKDPQGKRISGDIIYLQAHRWPWEQGP
jgi:hypothetical protein